MSGETNVNGREISASKKPMLIVRVLVFIVFVAVIMFVCAGDWLWPMGWLYLLIFGGVNLVSVLWVPIDEELMEERTQLKEDVKSWDKWLATIPSALFPFGFVVVAALDHRYGWPGSFSTGLVAAAAVVSVAGYGLSLWAARVNKFYARYVRIQKERGHVTITDGPYRIVRHPGYAGLMWYCLASGVVLDSVWSLIPAGMIAVLLIVRTALEDRTLQAELAGYTQYSQKTRYRLIPGIW